MSGLSSSDAAAPLQCPIEVQAAADARRNRDFNLHFKGIPQDWKSFAIPDVPGARGLRSRARHGIANAYFSDGVYSYIVKMAGTRTSKEVGPVRGAASSLYARVHGSPVCT